MENLSIKHARRLETEIDNEYNRTQSLMSSIYDYEIKESLKETAIKDTVNMIESRIAKLNTLSEIKFAIRGEISKFNDVSGVNDYCLHIAKLTSERLVLEGIETLSTPRSDRDYHTHETTYCAGLGQDERDVFHGQILKINREIRRYKDKCQGLNGAGKIEISKEHISFVKKLGLMD